MQDTKNDISKMPTTPQTMLDRLNKESIKFDLYEHEALFTVEQSKHVDATIPAHHTRNMFLRTKKKQNFLITLSHDTPIDLKKLAELLNVKNFSFGSTDRLMQILGVYPGSVTPLSAINAAPSDLQVILEEKMMRADKIAVHPLINTMTITFNPNDLLQLYKSYNHTPIILDLNSAAP